MIREQLFIWNLIKAALKSLLGLYIFIYIYIYENGKFKIFQDSNDPVR